MSKSMRLGISLPEDLVEDIDIIAKQDKKSRSQIIKSAVIRIFEEKKRRKIEKQATKIYKEIEEEELKLSEDFLSIAVETFPIYRKNQKEVSFNPSLSYYSLPLQLFQVSLISLKSICFRLFVPNPISAEV